jgi:hypothetical protein
MKRIPLILFVVASLAGGRETHAANIVRLQLSVTGLAGSVSMTPTGNWRGCANGYCSYEFLAGQRVTLIASASMFPRATLAKWLGACSGSSARCDVVLDLSKAVTARFTPVPLYVDVPEGRGTVSYSLGGSSCGGGCTAYPYGTQVGLLMHPCCGYDFTGWSPSCTVSGATCWVTLWRDTTVEPSFRCTSCAPTSQSPLDRTVSPSVRITPAGSGTILIDGHTCPSDCTISVNRGDSVILVARSGPVSFKGWSGSCMSALPRCVFPARRSAYGAEPRVTAVFG